MRLGGPVYNAGTTPEEWVRTVKRHGYRAAYCPVKLDADEATVAAYAKVARDADIIIAEVGAWSNPLSTDPIEARAALEKCQQSLALADRIGAVCCVNIAGSRGPKWDGPHLDNLTPDTFDLIVQTVREIIDAVQPTRRYFNNGALIQECFDLLGPYIKGCHAKDIVLRDTLTTHLDEVRPGLGRLEYGVLLREMHKLPEGTPLMLEHLPTEHDYADAADWVRGAARREGIDLRA